MMKKMRYLLFSMTVVLLGMVSHAEGLTEGELSFQYDSITPNMVGQATMDHLFVQGNVNFHSGDTQTVWFYLDDDEIYQNSKVQSLTPAAYNRSGDLYKEITYNSFQCDIYVPEGTSIISIEDEEGDAISYINGDRMPSSASLFWKLIGAKVIDGMTYNVYSVVCYNSNTVGSHLSGKNASSYSANGALKKDRTLFALTLHNDRQDQAESRMNQDLIIANQIFNIQESVDAGWDSNASTFFYGTGGNNESQVFMLYDRTGVYGSSGYDRNYFFLPDTAVLHGQTVTLPVRMQNQDAVAGFQTELFLPDGISIAKGEQGQPLVALSDRKGADHTIQAVEAGNGIVKITSVSPTLAAYSGDDGTLFLVTVQVPQGVDSVYTLELNNTLLTGTDGNTLYVNEATGELTVLPYNQGDVNNNGFYTIGDVVTTARYIMGQNPSPFYFMAADMNQDSQINATDLDMMSSSVLEDEAALADNYGQATDDVLYIKDFMITPGARKSVSVLLENGQEYTAFQTDITVSEGLSISKAGQDDAFAPGETRLSTGHRLDSYLHEDGSIRVISFSGDNAPILENEGTVFTFEVVADADYAGGTITLSRTLLSTADGEEYRPDDAECIVKRVLRGDVNGDGVVNVADINAVVNIILGGRASAEVLERADVNGDGNITISDINVLISLILS